MKAHLLFPDRDLDLGRHLVPNHEDLARDLELGTLVAAMARRDQLLADVSIRVLLDSLTDEAAIQYRQAIMQDFLEQPALLQRLYAVAVEALEERRSLWGFGRTSPRSTLSGARSHVEMFLKHLCRLRSIADDSGASVKSSGLQTLFDALQADLNDEYMARVDGHVKRLRFGDGILLSARLAKDNTGLDYVLRTPERQAAGWKERLGLKPRTTYSFTLSPRDDAGLGALEDLRSRGLNEVANAVVQSADHITSYFTLLRAELAFYVSCLNLHDALSRRGQPTTLPQVAPSDEGALRFADLRDPCLALQSTTPVVGNDADADGKSLLLVTGANSGGKSTFLRSVGLAQLMYQAGMFVTAKTYRASPSSGVFSHFVREEDASMRFGRLEEELGRMSALVPHVHPNALILLNESFHSTNEREGSEIARQIVRALRETRSRIVFVSHQYDFASSWQRDGSTVLFLQAQRNPDGRRDYHLVSGMPQPTAYGRDLYRKIFGCA